MFKASYINNGPAYIANAFRDWKNFKYMTRCVLTRKWNASIGRVLCFENWFVGMKFLLLKYKVKHLKQSCNKTTSFQYKTFVLPDQYSCKNENCVLVRGMLEVTRNLKKPRPEPETLGLSWVRVWV